MGANKLVNAEEVTEVIDLSRNNMVYVVVGGKLRALPVPYQGDLTIKTVNGNIQKYDTRESFLLK